MSISGLVGGSIVGGLVGKLIASPAVAPAAPLLAAPINLYSAAQSSFDETAHIDFRSNWQVQGGRLVCLELSNNDARISLDAPVVAGNAHFGLYDLDIAASTLKLNLGGDGAFSARNVAESWQAFQYYPGAEVLGNYTRAQTNPSTGFSGSIDNLQLYDLSTVDPNAVACDVIIIGGDSNSANATSEFVTPANRETAYDPRIWYMPCLRSTGSFGNVGNQRHVPFPMIEPCATVEARRMSPCHAAAAELVGWSAARGRPLLVMALGDPGSGLMNTEDWRKTSAVPTTGSRMWNEMLAMKAALEALGPAHQIVGAIWSLGANDTFGGDYEVSHGPAYSQFFADFRADIADVPMVLINIGDHYEPVGDTRGEAMRTFLRRFDQGSGDPRSITQFRTVEPPSGNQIAPGDATDPHFTAAGMQANGRTGGAALLSMLLA